MNEWPPTGCKVCGVPNCDDWMYHVSLVKADQAICGKCKIKMGKNVIENMEKKLNKSWLEICRAFIRGGWT